jgi:poly-gamma-glutamate synthesis protein (capsule biosynthesis protein)
MDKKWRYLIFVILLLTGFLAGFLELKDSQREIEITAGVVPHHLLAEEIIKDFFEYVSEEKPEVVVILSPDHFESGGSEIIKEPSPALKLDHGITNLIPFIEEYFPKAEIRPFLIPQKISLEKVREFALDLNLKTPKKTIVIASVDFSHYLPVSAAFLHDAKSIRTLINFEENNFENIEVDSWQSLYAARYFAKLRGGESPEIIAHNSSSDFSKIDGLKNEDNTSYFSVVFKKGEADKEEVKTMLFVGDIMLDRGTEYYAKKNSIFYPIEKIVRLFRGVDIVYGNLEGPIVENPPDFPDDSFRFAFSKENLEMLSFGKFNLLSLANNHTFNMESDGLEQTKEFLGGAGIDFVGHPFYCQEDYLIEKEGILFLSFNKTYPFNCSNEEIAEIVKETKEGNPEKYLIVTFHWGEEYQSKSSLLQRELAHSVIDSGADLIIGSHPHVVQEIENYQDKLIFYSLGNFIFDQSFSKETQQGFALGVELYEQESIFRLFPFQINLSQPFLMEREESEEFLSVLAEKSDLSLSKDIKNGIINQ